jgi:hypothetical protein
MWAPWAATEYTIRGKVVASLKSRLWWVLWIQVCSWLILAPKVLQLCTSHFVLVLCRLVWVSEACQFFLIPSQISSMPFYPSKVLRTRERAPTPYSSAIFCLGLTFESFKELGVRQKRSSHVVKHIFWTSRKLKEVLHLDSWKILIKLYFYYQNWKSKNMYMGLSNAIDMIEN